MMFTSPQRGSIGRSGIVTEVRERCKYSPEETQRCPGLFRDPQSEERFTAEYAENAEKDREMNGFFSALSAHSAMNDRGLGCGTTLNWTRGLRPVWSFF